MLQLKILICMKICNVYARQGTTDWVGRAVLSLKDKEKKWNNI